MISLIVLLPVFILILAALGIVLLQQNRPRIGFAWSVGAVTGILTTGLLLFLRQRIPLELVGDFWRSFGTYSTPPVFRLDLSSWPYAFSLVVLAWAFVLTDAARLETEAKPFNWAGGLTFTALGLLAVMAGNPLTLVSIWTAIDLVELVLVSTTAAGRRMGQQTVSIFAVRVTGTLLVLLAVLLARSQGIPFELVPTIPEPLAIYMLLAAGLRLGVLPLNIPYSREVYPWRGLSGVLRMVTPASSLVVLGRMPAQVMPEEWKPLLLGLSALAALYGGLMWLFADHELNGRPFWLAALAALAVACVINGNPQASIAWGVALILPGSLLFFYSARWQRNLVLPLLGMLGVAGLPFTPAAAGWLGVAGQARLSSFFFLITVVMMVWGYLRHAQRPRDELYRMERWIHVVYIAGLLFLVLGQWAVGIWGWPGSLTPGVWWASIFMSLLVALGGIAFYSFRNVREAERPSARWISAVARQAGGVIVGFLRLNWLYRFFAWIYHVIQNVIQLLTEIFEGDGGILWSLVLLALLVSLIWSGGSP